MLKLRTVSGLRTSTTIATQVPAIFIKLKYMLFNAEQKNKGKYQMVSHPLLKKSDLPAAAYL